MNGADFRIISMRDAGIDIDVIEDTGTFEGNAVKKATEIAIASGKPTLADDSGLEIDFLGGEPGVESADYMGRDTPYTVRNAHILKLMEGVTDEKRTARYVCVIAAAFPNGQVLTARRVFEGVIAREPKGGNGFGYDPIFFVPEYNQTAAEMPPELKNAVSHRGQALRQMRKNMLIRYVYSKSAVTSAVHLFLERGNQVLLLRRYNTGYSDGEYSVVAGHIDGGEDVYAAMIREAREEAGITVARRDVEAVHVMHRQSDGGEQMDWFFRCAEWDGEVTNAEPNKCDDLRWFDADSLPPNTIPYIRAALENYKNGVKFSVYGW
jgi:XTP/dITP diphosphohydrolase